MAQVGEIRATRLLPGREEIRAALGNRVLLQVTKQPGAALSIGSVVAAASKDAAYRSFTGSVSVEGTDRPLAVGTMALVFDSQVKAENTFMQVAQAAHLRTRIGECSVAVETVTTPGGMVSYWGYLQIRECLIIITLDTVDPQILSMSDFRALASAAAERAEATAG